MVGTRRNSKWFWFQSYDRSSSGIVPAKDLEEVYKLAGSNEIRVWEADWDGHEFHKSRLLKKRRRGDN